MGCGTSSNVATMGSASLGGKKTSGKKTSPVKTSGRLKALLNSLNDVQQNQDDKTCFRTFGCLLETAPDLLEQEINALASQADLNMMEVCVGSLVTCLELGLRGVFEAVKKFAQSIEADQQWHKSVQKSLEKAVTKEVQDVESKLEQVCSNSSMESLHGRILVCLSAFHRVNRQSNLINPRRFESYQLNLCLRVALGASWKGDAVAGGRANSGGVASWLPGTLIQLLGLGALSSDDCSEMSTLYGDLNESACAVPPGSCLILLDGATKLLLCYKTLLRAAASGEGNVKRTKVTITRENALFDSLDELTSHGVLNPPQAKLFTLMNPYFRRGLNQNESFGSGVEEGEGHGPRKEFFDLVTSQFTAEYGIWKVGQGTVTKAGLRELHANTRAMGLEEGFYVHIGQNSGMDQSTTNLTAKVVSLSGSAITVDKDLPSALGSDNHVLTYASPRSAPFIYRQGCEAFWFNSQTPENVQYKKQYFFLGWLIGASLLNKSQIGFALPRPFFSLLMAAKITQKPPNKNRADDPWGTFSPSLLDLKEVDTEVLTSVANIRKMNKTEFEVVLDCEDLPSSTTKEQYISRMAYELLVGQNSWQLEHVRQGFRAVLGQNGKAALVKFNVQPHNLQEMVCGIPKSASADFNIREVYRVVMEGDVQENSELTDALWEVLDSWPPVKKRKFLLFVTSMDKLPSPGSEALVVELPFVAYGIDDHKNTLMMLPQAHTCSNTLELPNYWESLNVLMEQGEIPAQDLKQKMRRILDEKLSVAVNNCSGYGLDEVGVAAPGFGGGGNSAVADSRFGGVAVSPMARVATPSFRRPLSSRRRSNQSEIHIPELGEEQNQVMSFAPPSPSFSLQRRLPDLDGDSDTGPQRKRSRIGQSGFRRGSDSNVGLDDMIDGFLEDSD